VGQVLPRQEPEVKRLTRADRPLKPVEADAQARAADVLDQSHGRLEVVGKARPGVELEGQLQACIRGPLGRLGEAQREAAQVLGRERPEGVARDHEHRDGKLAAQGQPSLEGLPVLGPGLPLAGQEAALEARRQGRDSVAGEGVLEGGDRPLLEKRIGLAEPEIDRIDVAGGVILEHRLERGLKAADRPQRRSHASRSRSRSTTSSSGTRSWTSESRSRTVTVWLVSDSPSIVRHQGVPASSWRA